MRAVSTQGLKQKKGRDKIVRGKKCISRMTAAVLVIRVEDEF